MLKLEAGFVHRGAVAEELDATVDGAFLIDALRVEGDRQLMGSRSVPADGVLRPTH